MVSLKPAFLKAVIIDRLPIRGNPVGVGRIGVVTIKILGVFYVPFLVLKNNFPEAVLTIRQQVVDVGTIINPLKKIPKTLPGIMIYTVFGVFFCLRRTLRLHSADDRQLFPSTNHHHMRTPS